MDLLQVLVVIASAVAIGAGVVVTYRGFKASDRAAGADPAARKSTPPRSSAPTRDPATIERLRRFFDGKECAVCKRPIPAVQRTGMKPGILDPATHETYSWDEIPADTVASMLESGLPLCASCRVEESFRNRFPDRVVDREGHAHDRLPAGS